VRREWGTPHCSNEGCGRWKVVQKGSGGAFVKVRKRDKVTLYEGSISGERHQPCSTQKYDQLLMSRIIRVKAKKTGFREDRIQGHSDLTTVL
jgi:hypothetical protein